MNRAYNDSMKPQEPSGSCTPHSSPPPHFARDIFFCTNQRGPGHDCCGNHGAQAAAAHCKQRIKELGLSGAGHVRVNSAGCLGRCQAAPVAVVYPEGVWYRYADLADIDEIVDSHLRNGRIVERLLVPPDAAA